MTEHNELSRVYTHGGRHAHLLPPWVSANSFGSALCGLSPDWPHYWFGTGSYVESEWAQRSPLCRACRRKSGKDMERPTSEERYGE